VREQLLDAVNAREAYDKAIQANGDALAPIWNIALLLEHSGKADEAERWYKQVLEKAPKEEEARFRLGYLRLQRQDYRGAAEAFEGCLKYRPQWPEAYANLALAYSGIGTMRSGFTKRCWKRIRRAWMRCAGWRHWRCSLPTSIRRWSSMCG
jgi:tetratricopeptide (TPR) repeat protein